MPLKIVLATLAQAIIVSGAIAGGEFYDDKYMYSDKELIMLEQVYERGLKDGKKTTVQNIVTSGSEVEDLSVGAGVKGYFANTAEDSTSNTESIGKSNQAGAGGHQVVNEDVKQQIAKIEESDDWSEKVRKEVVIPGAVDPRYLELDQFLNQPLVIEQSEPANILELVVNTIPQGWRVFFSNFKRDDFIDEYEMFVPTLPRGAVFKKLEESLGFKVSVMNQPDRPYVVVTKLEAE